MNLLHNSKSTATKASLGKTDSFFLELAQRLVLRQNKSAFPQTSLVSLQSGVMQ
jgi:hypothetical protein